MVSTIYQFPEQKTLSLASSDRIYTSAMAGLYGSTALGILLAGATAWNIHLMEIYLVATLGGLSWPSS